MKTVSISGSPRENVGKKDANQLRRDGKVPCVIYGGKDQVYFTATEKSFKSVVYTPEAMLVNIKVGSIEKTTILQDIQFHPTSERILHIDFLEIFPDKPVTIEIPVKTTGVSEGVIKGGKLIIKKRKIKVNALPADLPQHIIVDIAKLDIGDSVKVKDINVTKATLLSSPNDVVLSVKTTRAAATDATAPGEAAKAESK